MSYIFIISQHRTGSTLLKNILNAHSQITMAFDEMNFFEPFRNNTLDKYFKKFDISVDEFVELINQKKIYGTFWKEFEKSGITLDELMQELNKEEGISLKFVLKSILSLLKQKNNTTFAGVKYPIHFRKLNYLIKSFPNSKIIFLTRNPKAIIASKVNDPATKKRKRHLKFVSSLFHYFTLLYFSIEFNYSVKTYYKYKNNLYPVMYEDIVTNREETIENICSYCSIGYEGSMLKATGKKSSYNNINSDMMHQASIEKYKEVLSLFDRKLIDLLTGHYYKKIQNELSSHF
ncbi:MAG: sulfotransferase family protein [bacterium]